MVKASRLGEASSLTQSGVNLVNLSSGAQSSQRHWRQEEDGFVFVLSGEVTLIEDHAAVLLSAGEAAGFKVGVTVGHLWSIDPLNWRLTWKS